MARKSKYNHAMVNKSGYKIWSAALYIRLSREDGDKDESDSVVNQRSLLTEYAKGLEDVKVVDYFTDDGWSGTNFQRPAFEKMMENIKAGTINCVIVKDLSRFGRNYIEVGNYIEQIFPFMGIRFISVTDSLDSIKMPGQMNTIMVPFKNLINDEYCRDISNKVRSSLDNKRRSGKFIGSFCSYGYKKDPEDKGHLIIDEETAPIVKRIYDWFLEGFGVITIAKKLNDLGIVSPAEYKRCQGEKYKSPNTQIGGPKLWGYSSVKRILTHRVYCGDLIQGTMRTTSYKVNTLKRVPEDEWYITENAHEAIVPRETYEEVQRIFQSDTRVSPKKGKLTLFAGFVRCADCGRAMNRHTNRHSYGTYEYFVCSSYKKVSHQICSRHTMRVDKLEKAVLEAIRVQVSLAVEIDEVLDELEKAKKGVVTQSSQFDALVSAKEAEIDRYIRLKDGLYDDWKCDILTKEEYLSNKKRYQETIERLKNEIAALRKDQEKRTEIVSLRQNDFVESFIKYRNIEYLTRDVLLELVDQILVHEGGQITVQFRFRDELRHCKELLELNDKEVQSGVS